MYGGHGHRKFYVTEVNRVEEQHQAKLPDSKLSMAELQAGFKELADDFGSYSTLLYLEKETGYKRSELENWTVYAFNFNLQYLARQAACQKKYSEIMNRPKKKK